jgi:hypothetical protein
MGQDGVVSCTSASPSGGLLAGLACAVLVAQPCEARADDPVEPGLNWVRLPGAESCLPAQALAERVESRVGRVLFVSVAEAGLSVDGWVRPGTPDGWEVTLDVSEPGGRVLGRRELRFDGRDCHAIDESVALVIAITLYPRTGLVDGGIPLSPETNARLQALFGSEPVDPDPRELPLATATVVPAPGADPRASRAPEPARPASPERVRVTIGGVLALGQIPGLRPGVTAQVWLLPEGIWPIGVHGLWLAPSTAEAADVDGVAAFQLLAAGLSSCPFEPLPAIDGYVCIGAEAGRLRVASEGFAFGNGTRNDAIANLMAQLLLVPALSSVLRLQLGLDLIVPLLQRGYSVEAPDGRPTPLFRMPQLAARLQLGLALSL